MPIIVPPESGGPSPSPDVDRYTTRELVEETLGHLSGHTTSMGQVSWLAEPINEAATEFRIAEEDKVHRGITEIGYELVYVANVSNGVATVIPGTRGWSSSRPQAHEAGTLVTFGPRFPRHVILQAINDVIENLWPQLYGVGQFEFPFEPNVLTFQLPAEAEEVISVTWDPEGPQRTWPSIDYYFFDRQANTSEFPTGRSIDLPNSLTPGRMVRVRYMTRPKAITTEGKFEDSGLAPSAWPAVMYGALHRLSASLTLGELGTSSVGSNELSRVRPLNAVEVSQQYYALHIQFTDQERSRLQAENPVRVSFGR